MLTVHDLIRLAAERKASDIFIKAGAPPNWRLHGRIAAVDDNPMLSPEDTRRTAWPRRRHATDRHWCHGRCRGRRVAGQAGRQRWLPGLDG